MSTNFSPGGRLKKLIRRGVISIPGIFNAATAMLVERCGFDAAYISGAGLANGMGGLPDIGLLSLPEVVQQAQYITQSVRIPVIADGETGFGGPLHVMRTVTAYELAGLAGLHLEDQAMPKRCGHLSGKQLVSPLEMAEKISAAVRARSDPDFIIIARTDARGVGGLQDALDRGQQYVEAGADVIFPEALESRKEFELFAAKIKAPLMANMTEFGKSPLLTAQQLGEMGYCMVLFPMSTFRIMMKAAEEFLQGLKKSGTQRDWLEHMQTRQELYDLVRYPWYESLDRDLKAPPVKKPRR